MSVGTVDSTVSAPLVFLSYRRQDTEASALLLYKELKERFGAQTVCMDMYSIPAGGNWFEYIHDTLGTSALVLALIGPNWLTATDEKGRRLEDPDDVLRKELELALERDVRLIPVLVQGSTMPSADQLPGQLKKLVDYFPHKVGTGSFDSDAGELMEMVGTILDQIRVPERPPADPTESLSVQACLDGAGLKYHEAAGAFAIPFGGQRATQVIVFARELQDGTAFFSTEFDAYRGKKKNKVALYQRLLNVSFALDYVKAIGLSEGRFALTAEIPPGALTPEVADGLVRGLVALGDVKDENDLVDDASWQYRLELCRFQQDASITVDAERGRQEVQALLDSAGAAFGQVDLGIGEGPRPLSVHASARVISLIMARPGIRPGGDLKKLEQLLELNRAVNVAKLGLDSSGDVGLLYEVPRPVPDLVDRMKEQFTILIYGLILRL